MKKGVKFHISRAQGPLQLAKARIYFSASVQGSIFISAASELFLQSRAMSSESTPLGSSGVGVFHKSQCFDESIIVLVDCLIPGGTRRACVHILR